LQPENFTLISQWSCDGNSEHSQYKQHFSDPKFGDSNISCLPFVPVQLYYEENSELANKIIIWQNPRPSSPKYCTIYQ